MTPNSFNLILLLLAPMAAMVAADEAAPILTLYNKPGCESSDKGIQLGVEGCLFAQGQPAAGQSIMVHPREGGPGCLLAWPQETCGGLALPFNLEQILLGTKNYIVPVADQPACYSLDLDPKKFPTDGMRYNIKDEPCAQGHNLTKVETLGE